MSSLSFCSRSAVSHLDGRQVAAIIGQARDSLERTLSRPECRQLRNQLGLPNPGSMFFSSQVFSLMMGLTSDDGSHVDGHDVHLIDLARQVRYGQEPRYGVLGWLFGNASEHGWVADPDRRAMAGEIDAAVASGPQQPLSHSAWAGVTDFLRDGEGDVVLSMNPGADFPDRYLAWTSGTWRPAVRNSGEPYDELEVLWEQLSDGRQWDLAFAALQAGPDLQWHPGRYEFCDFTIGPAGSLIASNPLASR